VPLLTILLAVLLQAPPAAQEPTRVDPTKPPGETPLYRKLKKDEVALEGMLQRVECPRGRPVVFTMRVKDAVERFESPQLGDVDYIAHTPTFKGPMTCGGRGKGDLVRLTWKKAGNARRVVAVEFLPAK
jgi:hypothetical protein